MIQFLHVLNSLVIIMHCCCMELIFLLTFWWEVTIGVFDDAVAFNFTDVELKKQLKHVIIRFDDQNMHSFSSISDVIECSFKQ